MEVGLDRYPAPLPPLARLSSLALSLAPWTRCVW